MLGISLQAINVHPPRATALSKWLQPTWRLRAMSRRIGQLLAVVRDWNLGRSAVDVEVLELSTVLRCIIPGWANSHVGQRFEGTLFLAAYLTTGIFGLLMLGTEFGAMVLGVAFAIHVASAVKALIPRFETFRDRLIFTGITATAVGGDRILAGQRGFCTSGNTFEH